MGESREHSRTQPDGRKGVLLVQGGGGRGLGWLGVKGVGLWGMGW